MMEKTLTDVIPEFALIDDEKLKEGSLATFVEALQLGGWQPEDMAEIPFTLLIEPCPQSLLAHTRGVVRVSLAVAKALMAAYPDEAAFRYDEDALIAMALLHDVGKLLEYERTANGKYVKSEWGKRQRHPDSGAELAEKHGLPQKVVDGIRYHSHEGDGKRDTVEAIIVNHADFINFEPLKLKYG